MHGTNNIKNVEKDLKHIICRLDSSEKGQGPVAGPYTHNKKAFSFV